MIIQGSNVFLRAIEEEDLGLLYKWLNDPNICMNLLEFSFPRSKGQIKELYYSLQTDQVNQRLAIEANGRIIGMAFLTDIDWKNNHASIEIFLGDKKNVGRGYEFDTVMALMRYSFEELHLERLIAYLNENNKESFDLYCVKIGFKEEGRNKKWFYMNGRYWDRIHLGILSEEFFKFKDRVIK